MKPQLPGRLYRRQLTALALFGILIAAGELGFYFYKKYAPQQPEEVAFISDGAVSPALLAEFNPNDLDAKQWQQLGFSEKQVTTILNYKKVVGGSFKSKEQLKKCYAISPEKFEALAPYILLPETGSERWDYGVSFQKYVKKELKIPGRFNPDTYTSADWQQMGFTASQANAILKYKNFLGGSFVSKEKFKECFIISEENYRKLAPYLLLPDKTPESFQRYSKNNLPEKTKINYKPFDPNLLDPAGWQSLGFSEKQAAVIVNYRERNLRGSFRTLEDIQKCFVINAEKFEEMKPYIRLNPDNFKTSAPAYSGTKNDPSVPEVKTDFSKVDLNQITFRQLREFGFTEKDAARLLSFRKNLGGFVNKSQVLETYEIDRELAQKIVVTATLNNSAVPKYSLVDAPEDWLKTHPYFKFSADKIIFYRITNPNEQKIWKFIKVKPEYEAKMRLYLK